MWQPRGRCPQRLRSGVVWGEEKGGEGSASGAEMSLSRGGHWPVGSKRS